MTLDWDVSLLCHLVAVTLPFLQNRTTTHHPGLWCRNVKVGEMHTLMRQWLGPLCPVTLQGGAGFYDDCLVTPREGLTKHLWSKQTTPSKHEDHTQPMAISPKAKGRNIQGHPDPESSSGTGCEMH